ncbi:hypothetical protein NLJ89_g11030 [Agrocybe chaxingu]|uniref:Transposase n=1 Tax=Agrocybe chaxingu TaxID=84603 RepID=A0A9W8JQP8_9AGAR|nr:hypothetical protein NLJ89_g11030 [Agrocybe chaxingu]
MGYRAISSDVKECTLRLWEAGWTPHEISAVLCVSTASIYRWSDIYEECGTVTRPASGLQGRPHTIGLAAMAAIRELYLSHPDTYLDKLQWHLAIHFDIAISISALQKNLQQVGLTRKVLHKIAAERDEELRAEFLHVIQHDFSGTGWEFVIVNESSKNEHSLIRTHGRSQTGRPADIVAPFVRGQQYSLAAAMTVEGYLAANIIPGSFDSFSFFDFIVEDVNSFLR